MLVVVQTETRIRKSVLKPRAWKRAFQKTVPFWNKVSGTFRNVNGMLWCRLVFRGGTFLNSE